MKSAGYSGLFLDTLDSYQLTKPTQQPAQHRALLGIIKQLSPLFAHHLTLNRGFPLLPELVGQAEYVVAEGLYSHYQPKKNRYDQQTSAADQQWLTGQLNMAAKPGFRTQVIDHAEAGKPLCGGAENNQVRFFTLGNGWAFANMGDV
ncbi:hypothetical protein P4S72_18275 [Vibrio sp. PP-XX7]